MHAALSSRPLLLALLCAAGLIACGGSALPGPDAGDGRDGGEGRDRGADLDARPDVPAEDAGRDEGGEAAAPAMPPAYVAELVTRTPGDGGGFGEKRLPGVITGPPRGGGENAGSTDVLSLGQGGSVVLDFGVVLVDGPGDDLVVFENAFYVLGNRDRVFAEPAAVGVSLDGERFTEWPCDPEPPHAGCAGVTPVVANAERNDVPPYAPEAGGDRFDLAAIGVPRARYVRIRDLGVCCEGAEGTAGFDLDAVAVLNHAPLDMTADR